MKLYKVTDPNVDYDCVEHCLIIAKNEDQAILLAEPYMDITNAKVSELDITKETVLHCDTRWG